MVLEFQRVFNFVIQPNFQTDFQLFLKLSPHEPKIINERIKYFALLTKPPLKSKSGFYPHMMEDHNMLS
jgi:hypothetical protein